MTTTQGRDDVTTVYVTQDELEAMCTDERNELLDLAHDGEIVLVDGMAEKDYLEEQAAIRWNWLSD